MLTLFRENHCKYHLIPPHLSVGIFTGTVGFVVQVGNL